MKKWLLPILIVLLGIIFYVPENKEELKIPQVIYYEVDIKGEVLYPGVYKVPERTTYTKAVDMAGRTKKSVILDDNKCIEKNTSITVAKREKSIDINRASLEELISIPTIGVKKASDIIKYREKQKISSYAELKKILKITNNDALLKIMSYTVI